MIQKVSKGIFYHLHRLSKQFIFIKPPSSKFYWLRLIKQASHFESIFKSSLISSNRACITISINLYWKLVWLNIIIRVLRVSSYRILIRIYTHSKKRQRLLFFLFLIHDNIQSCLTFQYFSHHMRMLFKIKIKFPHSIFILVNYMSGSIHYLQSIFCLLHPLLIQFQYLIIVHLKLKIIHFLDVFQK